MTRRRTSAGHRFAASFIGAAVLLTAFAGRSAAELPAGEELTAEAVLGNEAAPVRLIAYESLTCTHCAEFHGDTFEKLKERYIDTGKVKFILRDYPQDRIALTAAMMARCTGPDRYFGMVDALFRSQDSWRSSNDPVEALRGIGRMAGLSNEDFDDCMGNSELFDFIVDSVKKGNERFGIRGTPTFVVDGEIAIEGAQPFAEFEKVLEPLVE